MLTNKHIFLPALFTTSILCQSIFINEFLASNVRDYAEIVDFDDYSDWIEIYNYEIEDYVFNGIFISDDFNNPLKWKIPDGSIIEGQSFLIVWADGYDEVPNQLYTRPYWPWDQFITSNYHTNFKLSKNGEELGLFKANSSETIFLVNQGDLWKYLDDGTDQDSAWIGLDFNDDYWSSGYAELGYGDGDEQTVVSYGSNENNKNITTYFRKVISIDNAEQIQNFTISLKRDDGAIVYLNGIEVLRENMPLGLIDYNTTAIDAIGSNEEDAFINTSFSSSLLDSGENIIAVEIHQVSESSSDISFDLELRGEIYSDIEIIDSVTFDQQITDVSYGKIFDGNTWGFFGEPTPGFSNHTTSIDDLELSETVQFSIESGYYNEPQIVELNIASNSEQIFYTLDGSRPNSDSFIYDNPIIIDTTTVIKARSIGSNKLPGITTSKTIFISEQNFLPTISLIVEPKTLWDENIGIYQNEFKQREIPVTIEYFKPQTGLRFTEDVGARLGGLNIWTKPQKPFTIYTRDRFGQNFINYQLFENKQIANFSRIVFRNGGDDWEETLIRDPMTESLVGNMMNCGYMAYTPASLFLNGSYWGIYNIREKFDSNYFFENFNVNPNSIDHLEYSLTQSGTELLVVEGSRDDYDNMIDYIQSNDLNNLITYDHIKNWMSIDSFIDHLIMIAFCANTSWEHNREWWRSIDLNEKWQWLIVDIDRGFDIFNSYRNLLDNLIEDYDLFQYLLESDYFRHRFIQRSAAHLNNTFMPQRINSIIDSLANEIALAMPRHIERWEEEGGISSLDDWEEELNEIKQFSEDRNNIVKDQINNELNLGGTIQIAVNIEPLGAGKIFINDVPLLHGDLEGTYFKDIILSIRAEPLPGYQFLGWEDVSDSMLINYNCIGDTNFSAIFLLSEEVVLPDLITQNTILTNNQPFAVLSDLEIPEGVTLTINEGVEIRMPENGNIIIDGKIVINGSKEEPVQINSHISVGDNRWGAICFNNSTDTSFVSNLKISGGSVGVDPVFHKGAISSINSNIILNHIDIENVLFPIYTEGGYLSIDSSTIKCDYICDFINVKGGQTIIENSIFYGSNAEDTDAIDLDNVVDGIIRNNRIYNFSGSNSDGIDIGENSQDILIYSNLIYHSKDKGISIGQSSTVNIFKNLIVGCSQGIAIKDNSYAYILNNTFFNNDISISCYEKNQGSGGGSAEIINTIFSKSISSSVFADQLSSYNVRYSISDTDLITGDGNIFSNPRFVDEGIYNFEIQSNSPCINSGDPNFQDDEDGSNSDMGAYYIFNDEDYPFEIPVQLTHQLKINEILASNNMTNTDALGQFDDWVEIFNPTNEPLDLSGLYLTDNLDNLTKWQFPVFVDMIMPNNYVLVWCDDQENQGVLHTNFKLSAYGESLGLIDRDGVTIIDSVTFGQQVTDLSLARTIDGFDDWSFMTPTPGYTNSVLSVSSENSIPDKFNLFQNYPNPFNPTTIIRYDLPKDKIINISIYDLRGRSIKSLINSYQPAGHHSIIWNATNDLNEPVSAGMYMYKIQTDDFRQVKKMLLIK
ncbi:MAG: hypothetical protein CMG04_08600 [Candidatus Marinimicrobia bacterium]|nr:hypothetical protein [Candidatus Neomarinimicrobiota bacterium]